MAGNSSYDIVFTAESLRRVHAFSYILVYSRRHYLRFVDAEDFLSEQSRASCQCQRYLDSRRISQQRILETTRRSRVSAIAVPSTNMAM